jgi:hypothetical protein
MRNYGLKIDPIKPEDYIFGSSPVSIEVINNSGNWENYLPTTEVQNLNGIEPFACVSFSLLNAIEILIRYQYGIEENFSDRFLASVSGTKEGGNSPQVVCEFLRKIGVVSQDLWPFNKDIKSFDDFYKPVSPKLYELAKEFNDKYEFKHEYVDVEHLDIALKCSPLMISVPAWYINEKGRYYRPLGIQDNHATLLININNDSMKVFDSYDSPIIKELEKDVKPMMAKRFYIKKKVKTKKTCWNFLKDFFTKRK